MVKKPFQYESRHNHAVKRARGPGGKFLGKNETVLACTTQVFKVINFSFLIIHHHQKKKLYL
jgi:hypothetical protein